MAIVFLFFSNSCCGHGSCASGGIAVVPGKREILTGQADPTSFFTFGIVYHDALDGSGDSHTGSTLLPRYK